MFRPIITSLAIATALAASAQSEMTATLGSNNTAVMSNGIITLNIGKDGRVSKMLHAANGSDNILGSSGIYFDYTADKNRALSPDKAEVVKLTDDYAEILYSNNTADIRYSQGYILRKGVSGVYSYVIVKGTGKSKDLKVKETRVCTRFAPSFLDGYVDDRMRGRIPSNSEMKEAEKKENTIQDATYYLADSTVYTKYNWAQFIVNDSVHGLMNGKVGVWNIPCSYEWLNGGPTRQELTVHATSKSPISIQMLQGEHFGGASMSYDDGETQIFGPFFIYVNSGASADEMIADAKAQASLQQAQWPFTWFENPLYPLDRSTVSGRISLRAGGSPANLRVVLGEPGVEIIRQGKKYIYWATTDADGNFSIPNVRKGDYSLYVYALDGTVTDELEYKGVSVTGEETRLGTIEWLPTVYEKLIWNIGENNRRADGFCVSDDLRAYGLWEKVPADLTFRPGVSDPAVDWYYAQCHNGTWSVKFNLDQMPEGDLHFTASVAGAANKPTVAVKVNGQSVTSWNFSSNDACIYRSATQAGRHWLKNCAIPASMFRQGENTLDLVMSGINKNGGVMYDCLKLEAGVPAAVGAIPTAPRTEIGRYSIQGQPVGSDYRGVVIVRYSDGSVQKLRR